MGAGHNGERGSKRRNYHLFLTSTKKIQMHTPALPASRTEAGLPIIHTQTHDDHETIHNTF